MVWQKDRRGVSSRPMPFSERGSRRKRVWRQTRTPLGADSVASGSGCGRLWELIRSWMGRCSLTNTDSVLSVSLRCWKPPFFGMCKISNLFFSSTNIKGRVFNIQKNLCAFFCQTTSGKACAHDKRTKCEKERPERFELIEFLQRGCGLRRSSLVGLRRRNNELNELTNCRAARVWGIAPERGSYSRIGARPYLPPFVPSFSLLPL